jgi:hypothetical protein
VVRRGLRPLDPPSVGTGYPEVDSVYENTPPFRTFCLDCSRFAPANWKKQGQPRNTVCSHCQRPICHIEQRGATS